MGRVIHTTNPTRARAATIKRMASLLREHSLSSKPGNETLDLAAALISNLQEIRDSVDRTAEAWEKRDYWIKADAFRRQWNWVEKILSGMKESLQSGNLPDLQKWILELKRKLDSTTAS